MAKSQREDFSSNPLFYLLIIFAIPFTLFMLFQQQDIRQRAQPTTPIYLIPSTERVGKGDTLAVALQIKTDAAPVKAVQVNLRYPSDKLSEPEISYANSPFQVTTEQVVGPGLIHIGRDATVPVAGYKQIASLQFVAMKDLALSEIALAPGSYALSNDNRSIPINLVVADSTYYNQNRPPNTQLFEGLFDLLIGLRDRITLF